MKHIDIGVEYYEPTAEQLQNLGRIAMRMKFDKLIYKKIDSDFLVYCPHCGKQHKLNEKQYKQIRASKVCPTCFYRASHSTQTPTNKGFAFISMMIGNKEYGYYVEYNFELGKPFEVRAVQTLFSCGPECYHRMMGTGPYGNVLTYRPDEKSWKITDTFSYSQYYGASFNVYERLMYEYGYCLYHMNESHSKKEYLKSNAKHITKSNQKKIAIDNLLNEDQMNAMVVFDLNDIELLLKYNGYINKNKTHLHDFLHHNITLNKYYLDYLDRNKINLGDYYTFLVNLSSMNMKYEKPTDFKFRSKKVEEMYIAAKDKMINKNITKRYVELPKYSKSNVVIEPFKTAEEIRNCGKTLHNCIGGYVEKYSRKSTDIYHLDLDGAIKIAIEISNGKLMQAYADHNSPCPKDLMEHIKSFCKTNDFSLGRYA